ncbi:helix-turn-helix transcriptional regulator [Vallitalea guaymasensis]|uniref:WYL domain-containing protein n=1 Tax=Vallitalea guaymasensis TaxID=1185412 RepID=A0A8J8M7Z3_9FIRM|nr:WYL domain-containing protein [Vallitalea guaymasensis]QUH28039.1 WYL domain-containing protein [Vallitalea guaymasensis]
MRVLSDAIVNKKMVTVIYCNADQLITKRNIEPVMLKYMWYTWYVAAYCLDKQDYRIFKLNRIQEIVQSNIDFGCDVFYEVFGDEVPARMTLTTDFFDDRCLCMMDAVAYKKK